MRATKPKSPRHMDLGRIHQGAAALGLIRDGDDSAYRDMLWTVARVRSARDLDAHGRGAVLRHLERCGWQQPRRPGRGKSGYEPGSQAALVRWLWAELFRAGHVTANTDQALRRYIAQHAGLERRGVDELAPQHLDRREIDQVIRELKSWLKRPVAPDRPREDPL